ncbi:MAG: hypothetical protein Q8O56_11810 [Solirubrobacteraceae bacterium]|nr:hypothetical protein [Solirubrobacteraceae bacterium]
MFAIVEAVFTLVFELLAKVLRLLGVGAAEAAPSAALDDLERGGRKARRARRQLGRQIKQARREGDREALIALWRQPRNEHYRSTRIDALMALVRIDPPAAEPLLREALERPDDPWVVLMALDQISARRMVGLRDAVERATDDPVPTVAKMAAHVAARLA